MLNIHNVQDTSKYKEKNTLTSFPKNVPFFFMRFSNVETVQVFSEGRGD